jgi:hypothetical protein
MFFDVYIFTIPASNYVVMWVFMNGRKRKRLNAQPTLPGSFEMPTYNPENVITVENVKDGVIVRAAYGNFSLRRKAFLIRELAAEGCIPDRFEQCSEWFLPEDLMWVVDCSLVEVGAAAIRRSRRWLRRLLLASCFVWLTEISLVLLLSR